MEEGDLALFPGASFATRNHDVEYPFRQQADYWYLTGHGEADGILLLSKGIDGLPNDGLFVLPKDAEKETWTGVRLGPEGAKSTLGFQEAWCLEEASKLIPEAIQKAKRLWYRIGENAALDKQVLGAVTASRMKARLGIHPPEAIVEPTHVLHEMRLFKTEEELSFMRQASAVSAEGHILAMAQAASGVGEWELQALLDYTFRRNGGDGWSYPAIVAGGSNACILHYNTNHQTLRDGDLCLIDAGAEFSCYAADITRTFPVNGKFMPDQKAAYESVLVAELAAIDACKPGASFNEVHMAAVRSLSASLVELGVLKESVEEIVEKELYKPWYLHNTSHWIGLDVHDAGRYKNGEEFRSLEAGMCLTVEPGLYFAENDERVPKALRGMGIRIEDDILITPGGNENLTLAAPKTVEDVEAACSAARVMPPVLDTELVAK